MTVRNQPNDLFGKQVRMPSNNRTSTVTTTHRTEECDTIIYRNAWSGQPVLRHAPTSRNEVIVIMRWISTIHVEVPLNLTINVPNGRFTSERRLKFRLMTVDLTRFLLRDRAEMQCNLLPPSSHMRQLMPLRVTRPSHGTHESWGRERRGACRTVKQ